MSDGSDAELADALTEEEAALLRLFDQAYHTAGGKEDRNKVIADWHTVKAALVRGGAEVSIKAQNPDLETAWRTIAWWEQTCAYWREEAHKGYALRDGLAHATPDARGPR